ncbi:CLUMA_CG006879, isoform A [Clunio marinus]|uniref:Tubulin alpha chain n=1 Tax=Clunio marinus TaxID=568069 RepID=A0A1J1I0N7_9DIPT|nr:CLUMA_CG006879, isoform A [Clunio marinus]
MEIASACWELFCLEHGIHADGMMCQEDDLDNNSNAFFSSSFSHNTSTIKCVPRVLLVDLEPIPIDEIRTGCYRSLFDPSTLITGKEDSASNYARGYNSLGCELIDLTLERIRRVVEVCENLQGFITYRSIGGGTGSGFGTLIQEKMADEFCKTCRHEFNIFPSPKISPVIVEPYNALLSTHHSMDYADCCILLDNEAIYDLCGLNLDISSPTYTNLNRVISQVVSTCTTSYRFSGAINIDMIEFQTNLVPYPRIHFPLCTYAPLVPVEKGPLADMSTQLITQACFHPQTQLVKCDPKKGKYICCCMLYRGDVEPTEINNAIREIKCKKRIKFVDWSPTAFKIGINYQAPTTVPRGDICSVSRAVCMLSNNSAIRCAWERVRIKFGKLFRRSAFIHHFECEGIEKCDLVEASENMLALIKDYEEVEKDC